MKKNNNEKNILDNIIIPSKIHFSSFLSSVKKNVYNLLNFDEKINKNFQEFLKNKDHGIKHSFLVYKKSLEIADILEKKSNKYNINRKLLYIMALCHDIGRFHLSSNLQKQINCEKKHNKCGLAQINLFYKKLKNKYKIDKRIYNKIKDYILNHDFLKKSLNKNLKEPLSIEGQIVRLADRISIDPDKELLRYYITGKRLNTVFYNKDIKFLDRLNFSFENKEKYIKENKLDQMMFFLVLFSINYKDFKNPELQDIYKEWEKNKHKIIKSFRKIAKIEGYNKHEIIDMIHLFYKYDKLKNI